MANGHEPAFKPLVTGATTSQSLNVRSIMDAMSDQTYAVPDYQRDSSQWDIPKKSLFIESLINNLTVPPLIVYPEDDQQTGLEHRQVIDGQQRLTTIKEYLDDRFALADEEEVDYAENVGPIIQGKKFSQLGPKIQRQIHNYTINLIVLPKNLELHLRLEIFRRINEAGVPLSAHDLRLATFGDSPRTWLIRLAGIFDPDREGAQRMLTHASERHELKLPWKDIGPWRDWWKDSRQSAGQAPSEMFLFYVIALDLQNLTTLLASSKALQALNLRYDKSTATVLDVYCAQLQREDQSPRAPQMLATMDALKTWFATFELWFREIRSGGMRISLNSSRKLALFIAAASRQWTSPSAVTDKQWQKVQIFLTEGPNRIRDVLKIDYPIAKGKWATQKEQIEQTQKICQKIAKLP